MIYVLQRARRDFGVWGTLRRAFQELWQVLQFPRLVQTAFVVSEQTGKSVRAQAIEMVRLLFGRGHLRPFDYYAYGLHDDRRYSFAEKKAFTSRRPYKLYNKFNNLEWKAICDDKMIAFGLLRGLGMPQPDVYAVYHPRARQFGNVPTLATPEALARHLRTAMTYPFFGKPITEGGGVGVSSVEGIDLERDVLLLTGGREISVEDYVREVPVAICANKKLRSSNTGYIFQERIEQHPFIDRLTGGRIACLRLIVLLGRDGPHLFRAFWKLAANDNITEHWLDGRAGNIKCCIDTTTGRIDQVVASNLDEAKSVYALYHHGRSIEVHPNTHERLLGAQLPYWRETVETCLSVAAALPGVRFQCWDVAMGVDGPLLVEVNYDGAISQVPGCRGFYDEQFDRIVDGIA